MEAHTEKNQTMEEPIPVQNSTNRKLYKAMGHTSHEQVNVNLKPKTPENESNNGSIVDDELRTTMYKDKMEVRKSLTKAVVTPLDNTSNDLKETKKHKNRTEKSAKKQQVDNSQTPPSTVDQNFEFKVAILHALHPKEILNPYQLKKIRSLLLKELDRTNDRCIHLNFLASTVGEGWFTLTCHNEQTTDWLVSRAKRIQPQLDTNIKVIPVNDRYMCIVYLPAEDAMPQDKFLSRLTKQNLGLSTEDWRILSIFAVANGRQCITLSIDEISKDIIQSQNGKLFLNFSQIDVFIEKGVQFTGKQRDGSEQGSMVEIYPTNYSPAESASLASSESKYAQPSEEKIASNFESYTVCNDNGSGSQAIYPIISTANVAEVPETNKARTKNKSAKSSTSGRGTSVYPSKMLSSIKTAFDDVGMKGIATPPRKNTRKTGNKDGK